MSQCQYKSPAGNCWKGMASTSRQKLWRLGFGGLVRKAACVSVSLCVDTRALPTPGALESLLHTSAGCLHPSAPVHWSVPRPQGSNVGPSLRRGVMSTEDDEAGCCFLRSNRPQGHSGIAVRIFAHCVKMERPLASGGTECTRRGCPSSVTASAYEPSMCPSRRPCL